MAIKVSFEKLKKPGLVAVRWVENPFTQADIEELTGALEKFALTTDGEFLQIWGE